ncbi:hypothetical protein V6N13_075231 [Hibiscus sabdariffa]|uniref:Uncharacterized protein n=1 Tax=Hibiscus sabdariffa TaxID=183260 RepID=A0ABR2UAW2_9ROSI
MEQTRAHLGAQSDAHQGGRMEQTRAHQGAQSCAHLGAESDRLPEPKTWRMQESPITKKAGNKEIVENPAILGLLFLFLCCADLGGYTSRPSIQSSASIEALSLSQVLCEQEDSQDLGKDRIRSSLAPSQVVSERVEWACVRASLQLQTSMVRLCSRKSSLQRVVQDGTKEEDNDNDRATEEVAKETQGVFKSRLVKMETMEDHFKDATRLILNKLESVRGSNAGEAKVKALRIEVEELKKELLSCKAAMRANQADEERAKQTHIEGWWER